MRPIDYRKLIMRRMRELTNEEYCWISTNLINEELGIDDTTPQRAGTNLNVLQRRGYVRRLKTLPLWRLTSKGREVSLDSFKC